MSVYEQEYFRSRTDPRRQIMYRQEAERIRDYLGYEPLIVVDVGCGTGGFLAQFPDSDWYGVEESQYATKMAGLRGVSFRLPAGTGWADLVVFRGVLQHHPNPVAALETARTWLRPGGLLAILATPNAGSLVYRLFQTLPCLVPELNYHVFSTTTLRQTLLNIGFEEPVFEYPYRGTPYARPLRDLASLALGRPAAFPGNQMECYARR